MAKGPSTSERARRVIALLGQLAPDTRISIADLAAEVGASQAQLAADLETLAMCGVAPYDPGDLMPLLIEDGMVEVWGELPAVRGPVRLSAAEARALAAALQAAGIGAGDPLAERLLDAAASGGFDAADLERTVRAASSAHETEVFESLAQALDSSSVVTLAYVRGGSEEATCRDVEPLALFAERGAWYLTGWCRKVGAWRTFRVDRIREATVSGDSFDPSVHGAPALGSAFDTAGLPCARLRFAPGEVFSDREWPGAHVLHTDEDGATIVDVPFGGTDWIARRVVARLGTVVVLEPSGLRQAVRELARKA